MRKRNTFMFLTLILSILFISVVYAAISDLEFSITSSAVVAPDQSNFQVEFSGVTVSDNKVATATASGITGTINVTGLIKKGDKVTAIYTVVNKSTDITAYLSCTATNSNEEYFTITSELASTKIEPANGTTTLAVTVELIKTPITESVQTAIGVELVASVTQPEGEGTTGPIVIATLIPFTIDGVEYQAEKGMTWEEFINSKYNGYGLKITDGKVYTTEDKQIYNLDKEVNSTEEIVSGTAYNYKPELTLDKEEINIEIEEGSSTTETLTATLTNVEGELTWISSDENVVEISGEGNTRTLTIKAGGTATITVSYGETSKTCTINVTEKPLPKIGDKVAYNEGTGYTSSIDASFIMQNMDWRILDIEDDGTIELISTQPTTSKLTLEGEEGYLYGPDNFDTLCDDLYGNGAGAESARNLKVEDINKLAGIMTDADKKALNSEYGIRRQYQYSSSAGYMQSRSSTDNGTSWGSWGNITGSAYQDFKEPGKTVIDKDNYLDEEGNQRIAELTNDTYSYAISSQITSSTADGISMSGLICCGLNDTNNALAGIIPTNQWMSSRCVYTDGYHVFFSVWYASERR